MSLLRAVQADPTSPEAEQRRQEWTEESRSLPTRQHREEAHRLSIGWEQALLDAQDALMKLYAHPESREASETAGTVVTTVEDFDRLTADALPNLLDRATTHTRRFLRETGQWADDISHEKLALRWGYEFMERFLVCGRAEVPCRPFLLLDSLIAKYFSQAEPLCYHQGLLSPLGRFLDGLTSRAVVSRDALMALFYHLYGFGQGQVVKVLGLGAAESQRVYKNFERWRRTGWERAMTEIGITDEDLQEIEVRSQRMLSNGVGVVASIKIFLLFTFYAKVLA